MRNLRGVQFSVFLHRKEDLDWFKTRASSTVSMAAASVGACAPAFSSLAQLVPVGAQQPSSLERPACYSSELPASSLRGFGSAHGMPCSELGGSSGAFTTCGQHSSGRCAALGSLRRNSLRSSSRWQRKAGSSNRLGSGRFGGVRAEQGQKEREKEGEETGSRPVRNVLKEMRDARGVQDAAKRGAAAATNEAKRDLDWYRSLKKPWFAPPVSCCVQAAWCMTALRLINIDQSDSGLETKSCCSKIVNEILRHKMLPGKECGCPRPCFTPSLDGCGYFVGPGLLF